jgi:hypothetical protein
VCKALTLDQYSRCGSADRSDPSQVESHALCLAVIKEDAGKCYLTGDLRYDCKKLVGVKQAMGVIDPVDTGPVYGGDDDAETDTGPAETATERLGFEDRKVPYTRLR